MVIDDCHLTAVYTISNIAHTVVIANGFVFVVGVGLTGLGCVRHHYVFIFIVVADNCATSGYGNHSVAVE